MSNITSASQAWIGVELMPTAGHAKVSFSLATTCFSILSEGCPCSYSEGQVFYVPLTYPDLGGHDGVYGSQSDLFLRGSRLGKAFLSVRSDR